MKERPVLFNGDMVRAILDGRKTQTRRVMTPQPVLENVFMGGANQQSWTHKGTATPAGWLMHNMCPFGQVGDRLWVRETFRLFDNYQECGCSDFPCNCPSHNSPIYRASNNDCEDKWTPSIHMPRSACRLVLEITDVRVERLNSISEEDALAEGIRRTDNNFGNGPAYCDYMLANLNDVAEWYNSPSDSFISLWQSIYGAESWQHSPWVWVIEFKRVEAHHEE